MRQKLKKNKVKSLIKPLFEEYIHPPILFFNI